MADPTPHDEYTPELLTLLQLIWGEGFLSPGGEAAVDVIVTGPELRHQTVLDIGCGLGGYDEVLARKYGARVIGLVVEGALLREAGFTGVELTDTSADYRALAHKEYDRLRTEQAPLAVKLLGAERHAYFIEDWRSITVVLDSGELRTGRLRARKP